MGAKLIPIFLFLCSMSWYAKAQLPAHEKDSSKTEYYYELDKCAEDLLFLHTKLQDAHPCLYCYTDSATIQNKYSLLVDSLLKDLNSTRTQITANEFTILIKQYLAFINDGHLDAHNQYALFKYIQQKGKFFPLQLLFENGQAFIKQDYSDYLTPGTLGNRLVAINGIPIEVIAAAMYKATSADAGIQIYKTRQLENLERFSIYYWMLYGAQDTYTITYISAIGEQGSVSLPGITAREIIEANEKLANEPTLTIQTNGSVAYMDINRFEDISNKPRTLYFWQFLENSFKKINQNHVENLIIDLRDNPGGMIYHAHMLLNYISAQNIESAFQIKSSHLLKESKKQGLLDFLQRNFNKQSYAAKIAHTPVGKFIPFSSKAHFIANEKLKFKGKVYLLVNGNTFSAAGLFTKYFKQHNLGQIVGEECGASPSYSFGNTLLVSLPNTHVQVYLSTAIVSNDKEHTYYNRGIMPDIALKRNIDAEAREEDSILQQVYELILKNHQEFVSSTSN